jgi:radical SAM protein with 4Fe4S-binding SPASM domain
MGHYRKHCITFFINEVCNMQCIYCTVRARKEGSQPRVLDLDFARRGIDDFFRDTDSRALRLFSNGEATLEFETMKGIVQHAEARAGDDLFVELQTNGVFGEEVARWIAERVDLLWISLDGTEDIQSLHRPLHSGASSFATIDRNIRLIKGSERTTIGLRPTVSTHSLDRQKELIDYAHRHGIRTLYAYPWLALFVKKPGVPDFIDFADRYLEAHHYARERGIFYGTIFMINFDEQVEINCRSLLPAPHLTPDGFVSCCDMANNGQGFFPSMFPEVLYGRWDPEAGVIHYDQDKIAKLRSRTLHNIPACEGCPAAAHCAGGCIGAAMMRSRDFYGVNEEFCEVTRYLFERMQHIVEEGYDPHRPLHPSCPGPGPC